MILSKILEEKEKVIARRKDAVPLGDLKIAVKGLSVKRADFKKAISEHGISLIAEIKRKSPSKGIMREDFNPVRIASEYVVAGANALSVLTDEKFFGGDVSYIKEIKNAVHIPILQKDFIIDEYQVYEAALYHADAILLIADILSEKQIADYRKIAEHLGMCALCEVHSDEDLTKVLNAGAQVIGINNRNLNTFKVDLETTPRLVRHIPAGKIIVAESGIKTHRDVMYLKSLGIHAVLIGEAFMKAGDIMTKVKEVMGTHATK